MSYPSGKNLKQIYLNGWVMFEGVWTAVDDLEMLFDQDITKNMLRTGVKAEKLFKRKE